MEDVSLIPELQDLPLHRREVNLRRKGAIHHARLRQRRTNESARRLVFGYLWGISSGARQGIGAADTSDKAPFVLSGVRMANRSGVRADESPWTAAEREAVREELMADRDRLAGELAVTESGIADLVRDSGDGAGDDVADAGSKTFEREQEMSLAENARELLLQTEHALERLDAGTYGVCESCGEPIGKSRLQAFPRATLCLACKQAEERG